MLIYSKQAFFDYISKIAPQCLINITLGCFIHNTYHYLSFVNGVRQASDLGFPASSAEESTCNAGDPGLIPGSESSLGEQVGYPLQYSWASLVTQMAKNLPAMQETRVRSLGQEDPLGKGMANPLQYSCPWGHRVRHY